MNSSDAVWNSLSLFHSSINAQKFLLNCYQKLDIDYIEKKSYENCYPFIYYLDHGKSYYQLSRQAPLSIKPILLFYGMVQLLKACLLTVDPNYPESATVLAHGVTARKRKKQNYDFLKDEVKIQKNGLFPHIAKKMFHVKQPLESEKYTMEFLLERIPELQHLFQFSLGKSCNYEIALENDHKASIPSRILDDLHMTLDRFQSFLKQVLPFEFQLTENTTQKETTTTTIDFKWLDTLNPVSSTPIQFDVVNKTYHIPNKKEHFCFLPEFLTHYLLLYNLSMISRYETEWCGELFHSFDNLDYPFINQFLNITHIKTPYLTLEFLQQKFH